MLLCIHTAGYEKREAAAALLPRRRCRIERRRGERKEKKALSVMIQWGILISNRGRNDATSSQGPSGVRDRAKNSTATAAAFGDIGIMLVCSTVWQTIFPMPSDMDSRQRTTTTTTTLCVRIAHTERVSQDQLEKRVESCAESSPIYKQKTYRERPPAH